MNNLTINRSRSIIGNTPVLYSGIWGSKPHGSLMKIIKYEYIYDVFKMIVGVIPIYEEKKKTKKVSNVTDGTNN